jgi:hypothetical protein
LPGHSRTFAAQQYRTLLGVGQLAGQNLGEAISERLMLEAGGSLSFPRRPWGT